jgi:hypothetical protein
MRITTSTINASTISTNVVTTWHFNGPDDQDGSAGVREPRRPRTPGGTDALVEPGWAIALSGQTG